MDDELPVIIYAILKSKSFGNFNNILDSLEQFIKVNN